MRRLFVGCVALLWVVSAEVSAEPPGEAKQKAQKLFQRAQDDYRRGHYAAAARGYEEAYIVAPIPAFLFNAAQAHRLDNQPELALAAYKRFLAQAPEHVLAKDASSFALLIEKGLVPETGVPRAGAIPLLPGPAPLPAEKASSGAGLRITGLVLGGASLVMFGLSAKFARDAKADHDAIENFDQPAWSDAVLARQAHGEQAERRMIITGIAGSAALVTGGVLYWIGWRRGRNVEVQPIVGPNGGAVSLEVGF